MIHLKQKTKTEETVTKKQQKETFIFKGSLLPKPNQRVFKLNILTGIVTEVEVFLKSDTVNYLDIIQGNSTQNKAILIEDNNDYIIKLNLNNAIIYFTQKYPNLTIIKGKHHKITKVMKNGINAQLYYRLLEWKDEHMTEWLKFAQDNGVERLCECNVELLTVLINNYLDK